MIDRTIYETSSVQIGVFRCSADDPSFGDSGPIETFCFVFPRSSVVIEHREGTPFVADPNVVVLYNRGQLYRRKAVSADGDRCDWFAVSEAVMRDAVGRYDARAAEASERPVRFARVASDSRLYREQRELFVAVRERRADPLDVEERVVGMLARLLRSAYDASPRSTAANARADSELVHAARAFLGRHFAEPLALADVASGVHASVFHLCRTFRRQTGMTLHAYREQLRLRASIEAIERTSDLTEVALDHGYSSHSHYTARFRRTFGLAPSALRRAIGN
ncbi:MAG: helix-turn-helix transcriptional regulator [Acidobacteria bacterium]|nr:helix-turn-helix transcriptional regulator [Acidobacteriota bacterium]MBV9476549.1 helix-turn-helix transcriptional regulator [Acidobacteriota bacterium]